MARKTATTPEEMNRDAYAKQRVAQLPGEWIVRAGGLGLLAKRGTSTALFNDLQTMEGLQRQARRNPLALLQMLPYIVPEVDLAKWNFLRLGASSEAVRIKAMAKEAKSGKAADTSSDTTKQAKTGKGMEAPDGTMAIDEMFNNLPDEVGNFATALGMNTIMVLFTGQAITEAVPADDGRGVKEVWPINPLTTTFRREADSSLGLYQRQLSPVKPGEPTILGNLVKLPPERTFWKSIDPTPDDPSGAAPFAPVLTEVLTYLGFIYNLSLAWKRVGLPKYDVGFDFEMWYKISQTIPFLQTPEDIEAWVRDKFLQAQKDFAAADADSVFYHDKNSEVNVTGQASAWPNIDQIYNIYRSRLVMALKHLPALMGIVDGSTETWTITQWKIWSAGLETIVRAACEPLVRSASLHLRLLGLPYTAELEYNPVRVSQRLVDAQAEAAEIQNAARKRDEGWITQDEASMAITGTAAVGEPLAAQILAGNEQDATEKKGGEPVPGGSTGSGTGGAKPTNPETRSEEGRGKQAAEARRATYHERNATRRLEFERAELRKEAA